MRQLTIREVYEMIYKFNLKKYIRLGYHNELANRKANIIAVKTTWEEFNYLTNDSCLYCYT